jgi:putative tryptophan/tyrosine transport system ATP-binding protein
MEVVRLVLDALVAGLPYAFCFLGIWLVFRLLNDFDLTVNGSFTLGAAVTAALVTRQAWNPVAATVAGAAAGAVAGLFTAFVHLKMRVILLLAGIITMIALYSVNLRIMILPNVSFLNHSTIFSPFITGGPIASDLGSLAFVGVIVILISAGLALFLKTEFGLGMRATGANPQMARAVGINTGSTVLVFLVLGNVLVGLSGAITAQQQFFADISMGNEVILIGITSILLGEIILWRKGSVWYAIAGVIAGTCAYQIAEAIAVRAGLQPSDLSAFTSALLLVTIGGSLLLGKGETWLRIRRKPAKAKPARAGTASQFPGDGQRAEVTDPALPQAGSRPEPAADAEPPSWPARTAGVRQPGAGAMLALDDVRVTYNRGKPNETAALRGINLDIPAGQFLTVIGSNGAGKSTLVSVVAGTVSPTEGAVRLHGKDVTREPEHRRAQYVSRVFQDPLAGTCPDFTVAENLALASKRGARRGLAAAVTKSRRKEFADYLGEFGLGFEDRLTDKVGGLSGGQRQALSILMAVLQTHDVLLLDEHTAALDPKNQALLLDMTDHLVRESGCTTVMVTHNMEHAIRYGDRMIMMHRGQILTDAEGKQKGQLTVPKLIELFHHAGDSVVTDEMLLA